MDRSSVKDFIANHPCVDHLPAVGAMTGVWTLGLTAAPSVLTAFLEGLGALAGLVLAAATFAAAMLAQSSSRVTVLLRQKYAVVLARNWNSILRAALLIGVAALIMLLLVDAQTRLVLVSGAYMLVLLGARGWRAVSWFTATQYADISSAAFPPLVEVPPTRMPEERHRRGA